MSFKVIGIGEVLWDVFPGGKKLGGAPANFAYHAHALGADAYVVSRVGNDALGREIVAALDSLGLATTCVSIDPTRPTGTVTVEVTPDGQPRYTIHEGVAWDYLNADTATFERAAAADAICFGSLAQRSADSRAAVRSLLEVSRPAALRIFDVNLRQNFYSRDVIEGSLEVANVLKLNDAELPILARLLGLKENAEQVQLAELAQRHGLRLIAYTRGSRGSMLFDGKEWSEHAAREIDVKDTVGAGDAFTGAVAMGMLAGWDLPMIGRRANEIAAYVCTCDGATPPLPEELKAAFKA